VHTLQSLANAGLINLTAITQGRSFTKRIFESKRASNVWERLTATSPFKPHLSMLLVRTLANCGGYVFFLLLAILTSDLAPENWSPCYERFPEDIVVVLPIGE